MRDLRKGRRANARQGVNKGVTQSKSWISPLRKLTVTQAATTITASHYIVLSCNWSLKICIKQLPHQNASLGRHKKLIDYKLHVLFCSL